LIKENLQVLNCEMRKLFGRYILVRKADVERITEALSLVREKEAENEEKERKNGQDFQLLPDQRTVRQD